MVGQEWERKNAEILNEQTRISFNKHRDPQLDGHNQL